MQENNVMEIKIDIETLRNNKLMVCTPMYGKSASF